MEDAAKAAVTDDVKPYEKCVSLTIYDFPSDPPQGDVDNIIKVIQDAMNGVVYVDDKQVTRVVAQRFLPEEYEQSRDLPEVMQTAVVNDPPFVFIWITDDPLGEAQ